MAKISIIMFLNWMTATMGYYGLSLISVHLTDDIYVNFVLFAVIEIPSYIFCVLVGPKICFKKSISKKLKYKKIILILYLGHGWFWKKNCIGILPGFSWNRMYYCSFY